jgi:hypothetical protein
MQVQRYSPVRRKSNLPLIIAGCAGLVALCGVAALAIGLVAMTMLPGIAAQAIGLEPAGDTDTIFNQPVAPTPVIIVQATIPVHQVVLNAGQFGQQQINSEHPGIEIALGNESTAVGDESAPSEPTVLRATFDENALVDVCRQYSPLCSAAGEPIRNVTFDLRPGGVIANGDFFIPQAGIWQRVGVVMHLTGANTLAVVGVDINGSLYSAPPGDMADMVNQAAQAANDALRQLSMQTGGTSYALSEVYADDTTLTLIMR